MRTRTRTTGAVAVPGGSVRPGPADAPRGPPASVAAVADRGRDLMEIPQGALCSESLAARPLAERQVPQCPSPCKAPAFRARARIPSPNSESEFRVGTAGKSTGPPPGRHPTGPVQSRDLWDPEVPQCRACMILLPRCDARKTISPIVGRLVCAPNESK